MRRRLTHAWTPVLLAVITVTGARAARPQGLPDGDRAEAREDVKRREEYFWQQRSHPATTRPYEAMTRLRLEAFAREAGPSPASAAGLGTGSWRTLGPAGLFGPDNGYFQSGPQLDAGRVTTASLDSGIRPLESADSWRKGATAARIGTLRAE